MVRFSFVRGATFITLLTTATFIAVACGSEKNSSTQYGPPAGMGYCMDSCTKDCSQDNDCNVSNGELCCDLGSAGKTCLDASVCPRFCSDDSKCSTADGQACVQVSLAVKDKVCTQPENAIRTCSTDSNCETTEVCCGIYGQSICTLPGNCPKSCKASSECDATANEICCTTAKLLEPNLKVDGLCLNADYQTCPKACKQSAECNTTDGEICCEGVCSTSCRETCSTSSDCTNQICCKSATTRLPPSTVVFSTGPRCTGTPFYDCSDSDCATVPGCVPSANGSCMEDWDYTCSDMTTQTACSSLPGCTFTGATSGTCTTVDSYDCEDMSLYGYSCSTLAGCTTASAGTCETWDYLTCGGMTSSTECAMLAGCAWDSTSLLCAGTPTPCASLTSETACATSYNCDWSADSVCGGTPTPCSSLTTSTTCDASYNCNWTTAGACTGTPTPCSALSATSCGTSENCIWSSNDACTGTPTPCSRLTPTQCLNQDGCDLEIE